MSAFLIDALATHRLTRLVVEDEITREVRYHVWEKYPPESTKIGYALTCPYCTSVWIGAGVSVLRHTMPKTWSILAHALAASAVTSLLEEHR